MENIVDKVKALIANLLQDNEIELVEMTYRREAGGMVLRLFVEKEGGITIDDCARLNERIGEILDTEDVMPEQYILEVSSPGLDRSLKTRRDFERAMGKEIRVHTYEPVADKRDHEGVVTAVDDVSVTVGGIAIRLDKVAKAKLVI
jgi:ribosome maturation factor RimP